MTVESENDAGSLLRRIYGEGTGESLATGHDAQTLLAAQQTLFDAGVDADALYERAVGEIEVSDRLTEHGIRPPRRLWGLSDDEFANLDDAQLEHHLAAYGISVPDMLAGLEDTVRVKTRRLSLGRLLGTLGGATHWQHRPALAAGVVFGLLLVGGGGGATYFALQYSRPAGYDIREMAALPAVKTEVVNATSPPAVTSKRADEHMLASTRFEPAVPENTPAPPVNAEPLGVTRSAADAAAENTGMVAVTDRPPVVISTSDLLAGTEPGAALPAYAGVSAGLSKAATLEATAAPAPETKRVKEFVFEPGDTLSHGLAMSGLPVDRWSDLVDRVGTVFHPGDRAIFYFENDEFEQLVIVRRKNQRITVTSDLDVHTATASASRVDAVKGSVQTSLFAALAALLDEKTAWRVSTRLKHAEVPLKTLSKGSTFDVRIERITGKNGETIGFGAIRGVRIDTVRKGTYTVGEVPGYSA
jgi:hypothetical protein